MLHHTMFVVLFRSPLVVSLLLLGHTMAMAQGGLPMAEPAEVGMSAEHLATIDGQVDAALSEGQMAGAVVLIGRQGKIVWRKAFGHRQIEPSKEPMTPETIFDLASLTKPIATATSVMILADRDQLDLNAPAAQYLPEFAANGKQAVTIAHLLTHTSGLTPDNALADYADGPAKSWQRINALPLRSPAGERFAYSDVGFLVLGQLVEQVSGQALDRFAQEHIFQPLEMSSTCYRVPPELHAQCAATEKRGDAWLRGEVHDPRAAALQGVAGHAGLFSTADDLARYAQMLLGGGSLEGRRVLSAEQVKAMLGSRAVSGGIRTWGWDRRTGFSSNRGAIMSDSAFGHGGFTGTGMWIDPGHELFVIVLTNRLHPDGKGSVNRLIGRIGTIAVEAINKQHQESN
jgi:serine-type D-Ala-D-Ala carboxypeptidase